MSVLTSLGLDIVGMVGLGIVITSNNSK